MSEHVFQSLVCADFRRLSAEQRVETDSGLRFQAVSLGVDDEMRSLTLSSSAVEFSANSHREPVLTHVVDGLYLTARAIPVEQVTDSGDASWSGTEQQEPAPEVGPDEEEDTKLDERPNTDEDPNAGKDANTGKDPNTGRDADIGQNPATDEDSDTKQEKDPETQQNLDNGTGTDTDSEVVLTHAIATRDPRSYGPIRPAQFWGARWWADELPSSGDCSPVLAEPEPGCDVDGVRDWVLAQQAGEQWLLALVSALYGTRAGDGKRIVFVGDDPAEIARWIAAGTLLLPQKHALRVSFRVFADSPAHDEHEVLALPSEWSGNLDHDGEFVVFDLAESRLPAVEPEDNALHWAPRFLRSDPFYVVDAVELARQFARNDGRVWAESGDRWASSVLVLEERAEDRAAALAEWLSAAAPESVKEARGQVVAAILSAGPDASVLRTLIPGVGTDALAGQVRYALLWAEIDELNREHRPGDVPPLPEREWSQHEREQATALVEGAAATTPPEQLDSLLRIASRFELAPSAGRFGGGATRFVTWWIDHPDAEIDPSPWPCAEEMLDLLRDEMSARLERADADEVIGAVRQHWWRILLPTVVDPFMTLDALVVSSAVEAGGRARAEAIDTLREHLRAPERRDVVEAVWSALFEFSDPTMGEVLEFLARASDVTKSLAQRVFALLEKATVSAGYLDVLRKLVEHSWTPEQESMLSMWQEDGKLRFWLNGFRKHADGSDAVKLREVSDRVLAARSDEILDALLAVDVAVAAEVVRLGGENLPAMLARELPAVWSDSEKDRTDKAVALTFFIACLDSASIELRSNVDPKLEQWARSRGPGDHRRIHRLLRAVDPESATIWQEWLRELPRDEAAERSRRFFRRLRRRG